MIDRAISPEQSMSESEAALVAGLLASLPHGVIEMSPNVAGLVHTSTNLATVSTQGDEVLIETSQLSSIASAKLAAARRVVTLLRTAGFQAEHSGNYPGWKPEAATDIVRKAQSVYQGILGHVPELAAMHAGLECGVIGEKAMARSPSPPSKKSFASEMASADRPRSDSDRSAAARPWGTGLLLEYRVVPELPRSRFR